LFFVVGHTVLAKTWLEEDETANPRRYLKKRRNEPRNRRVYALAALHARPVSW
jgi:hypothetical protein